MPARMTNHKNKKPAIETSNKRSSQKEITLETSIPTTILKPGFSVMPVNGYKEKSGVLQEFEKNDNEALINCTDDLLWSVSRDFKLIAANRSFIKGLENFAGLTFKPGDYLLLKDVFPADLLTFWEESYRKALLGESFKSEVHTAAFNNWKESWTDTSFNPIFNDDTIVGVACYSRNITEKKSAEEKLKQSEARLVAAQEVSKVGSWETDLLSLEVIWSEETYRIFEIDPATFQTSHPGFLEFVHPEDRAKVEAAFAGSLTGDSVNTLEHRILTTSGGIKIVEERWRIFHNDHGHPARAIGTCQDITGRKNAEEKIIENELRYRSLIEQATDTICIADASLKIIDINRIGCQMLGYSKAECLLLSIPDLFLAEDLKANPFKIDDIVSGQIIRNERRFKRKGGTLIEVEISGRMVKDGRFVMFAHDITERKLADKTIQAAYNEKNTILESIADAFFAVDKNWVVTYWNKEAEKMLQTPKNKILDRYLWEVFPNSINSESYRKYLQAVDTNQVIHFEDHYLPLDKWYEISAYPSLTGLSVYFKDITERKKSEAAIKKAYEEKDTVLERIDDGFFAVDKNSLVTYWNKRAEILLNVNKEDMIGQDLHKTFAPSGSATFYENYQKAIREKTTIHFEEFSKRTNKWFAVSAYGSDNGLSVYFKDVTERKNSEDRIKESEKRYRQIVETAQEGIWMIDENNKTSFVNKKMCEILEYTEAEMMGRTNFSFKTAEEQKIALQQIERRKKGLGESHESKFITKSGRHIITQVSTNPIMGEDGSYLGALAMITDITERKQAELHLRESNERYDLISKATNDMVWDWDLVTGKVYRNREGWKKIFRTSDQEIENESMHDWDNRIHPEDLEKVMQVNGEIQRLEKDFFEVECRVLRDDGTYAYIHDRGNIIRNEQGKAIRLLGATQDITLRKEAELQVAKSEVRFRSLVQSSSDLISIVDEKGYYLYSSPAVKRVLGYEPGFIVGKNAFSFIHPDDISIIKAHMEEKKGGKYHEVAPFRFKNDKGEWRWLESKITDMSNNPEVQGYIFNSRDVTERKMAEEEINKLSIIARETVNAVIITDTEGKIIWVNEAFTRITEFEFEEVIGKKPGAFLQGDETSLSVVRFMRNELEKIKAFECDIINYSKTGRKYWMRIQSQPQFDEAGKLKYFFAIETDITKEKEAEEILKASEERYRYLFNNNPSSIFIWDIDDFSILEVNETAVALYGYSREEFLAKTVLDLSLPEDQDKIRRFASVARQKFDFRSEVGCNHLNKSGEEMYMNISSHRIQFKGRTVILALATNVTDKIFLERELENERLIKQQEITDAVISAQEQERQELGGELHDNINQILAGSLLYLGLAKKDLKIEHPYLNETDTLINSAIVEIRNLSHSLIPPSLTESELLGALDNIIEVTQKTSGIMISLQAFGFDESIMPDKLKLSIYRIVQEQFNNILKHADAQKVIVRLIQDNEKTVLSIKDDGVGFDTSKKANGVGLMNIKTRASLFNGDMTIIASPGRGCELRVLFN